MGGVKHGIKRSFCPLPTKRMGLTTFDNILFVVAHNGKIVEFFFYLVAGDRQQCIQMMKTEEKNKIIKYYQITLFSKQKGFSLP